MISPDHLKILACPACDSRPPLKEDPAYSKLVCAQCGRAYPVRGGIPIMLLEDNHG